LLGTELLDTHNIGDGKLYNDDDDDQDGNNVVVRSPAQVVRTQTKCDTKQNAQYN